MGAPKAYPPGFVVDVQDTDVRATTTPKPETGLPAVEWVLSHSAQDRDEALKLGQTYIHWFHEVVAAIRREAYQQGRADAQAGMPSATTFDYQFTTGGQRAGCLGVLIPGSPDVNRSPDATSRVAASGGA